MITDEMSEKALSVLADYASGCPSLDPHSDVCDDVTCACRTVMRAALYAVAPMIREQVVDACLQAVNDAGWYQQTPDVSWHHVDCQHDHVEIAIRAVKEQEP